MLITYGGRKSGGAIPYYQIMKFRNKIKKHRNRSKFTFEKHWGFKKNFKRDYQAKKVFKKTAFLFYR